MQKHASFRWHLAAVFFALAVASQPLAMHTQSAENIGVASERSGEALGRASTQGLAVNGTLSLCTEDRASRMGRIERGPETCGERYDGFFRIYAKALKS